MPTFDVVSKLEQHELENALSQAKKEIATRYDFKDSKAEIDKTEEGIVLKGASEAKIEATLDILREKLVKRKISLKILDPQKVLPAGGMTFRQVLKLQEGVSSEKAKEIVKAIKDSKLKVQAAIQGDLVRVTGKKRDDLQECIAFLKSKDFNLPLQYVNFRD